MFKYKARSIMEKNSQISPNNCNDDYEKHNKANYEDDEHENNKEKRAEDPQKISYFKLFRFSTWLDYLLIFVGLLAAVADGFVHPVNIMQYGFYINVLVDHDSQVIDVSRPNCSKATNTSFEHYADQEVYDLGRQFVVGTTVVAVIHWLFTYIHVVCMNTAAERQAFRIRSMFLRSVLKQNVGWYDTHQTGEFASRTSEDLNKLQDGIGEKLGLFVFNVATFILLVMNAFLHGWKLTLVMLSVTPIIIFATTVVNNAQTSYAEKEFKAYGRSAANAEEALSAIRTVVAFGGEAKEIKRYEDNLKYATDVVIKRGLLTAVGGAIMYLATFGMYALAFWYGTKMVLDSRGQSKPEFHMASLMNVFFSIITASIYMGQIGPYLESFSQATAAAVSIFQIIDRVPPIDSSSEEGLKPASLKGEIEFESVFFDYPNRPDVTILRGLNLKINNGDTVALVGESGCGKSTTIQLLQRFYDPVQGLVKLDGRNIKELHLGWLRDQIGVVGQEPVLFGTTIGENIGYGKDEATQEDIEKAARGANAHDFIMNLPSKYETVLGERGAQLSGGQKQRIAIARALIKNPSILLLDEATSALDSTSEKIVQDALEKAGEGRTTIVVAHRLSTIRNATKIAAIRAGQVVELGNHEQLMQLKGIYHKLVTTHASEEEKDEADDLHEGLLREYEEKAFLAEIKRLSVVEENFLKESSRQASIVSFAKQLLKQGESVSIGKIMTWNMPEWRYIVAGCAGALLKGGSVPAFSMVFGLILGIMSDCNTDVARSRSLLLSCMLIVIGAGCALGNFLQVYMFAISGIGLTRRLRTKSFAAMLKQEIAWFDDRNNSVGVLCTRLASDAASVQGAAGTQLGLILQSVCTLGVASTIALVLNWKLALVSMVAIPLVLAVTVLEFKVASGLISSEVTSLENANKLAVEVISNIRTVASLHKEKTFSDLYAKYLRATHIDALKTTHCHGFLFGLGSAIPWMATGITLFYGAFLMLTDHLRYANVFQITQLLVYGAMTVGHALSATPNLNKGIVAAGRICKLLERKPEIDCSSTESGLRLSDDKQFDIHFNDAHFAYPTRPKMKILRGLDLTIPPGKVVAIVGSSGCGKSTAIQLLQRFYNPRRGNVTLDDQDIAALDLGWLRSQMGLVQQEPILFDRTIAENIAYGDNTRQPTTEEILQAATSANAHNFIAKMPLGYDTRVGDKGTQLSGGQKQRIAIARALIRNPKILLLDEATSALDTKSEKIVQEAIEVAQKGRTCITVAHRLSTIKNADLIAVIHQGRVVEIGSHDELLALGGHYHKFYKRH